MDIEGSEVAVLNSTSLTLKNPATADNSTFNLNLQTAEADIAADDVLAKINFPSPNEGTGTDALLTAAAIQAISEGDFSSSSNATSLQFMTGASEAATTKMTITSAGKVILADQLEVGTFNASQTNSGEAWIGRASDREDGTVTVQLGGNATTDTRFEIVDRAWSAQIASISGEAPDQSFILDKEGNVHLGYAGDTWHGDYTAITGPNYSLVTDTAAGASKGVTLAYNAYIDSGNAWTYMNGDEASYYQQYDGVHIFSTAPAGSANADITFTEALRIHSNGDISFGNHGASTPSSSVFGLTYYDADSDYAYFKSAANGTGGLTHYQFINTNGTVGQIYTSGSATTYATSSDYRLKENVDYDWDATTRLKQLKPARFNWIVDDTNTLEDGFLAHEVSSIVPTAVGGTKDGTETLENVVLDSNNVVLNKAVTETAWTAGKANGMYPSNSTWKASHTQPVFQDIDHSKLVPLLVKTIQELEARITTLEG